MMRSDISLRCSVCGERIHAAGATPFCPRCLLQAGLPEDLRSDGHAGTPDEPDAMPEPGQIFGRFRIIRLLGRGGMGAVFEAEDMETDRRVALKIMRQALDSESARQRFLREGRLAASINHPNSVYIFGTEEIAGIPAIAMELVAGQDLQERVRQTGPLPPAEAVAYLLQIIAGLQAAHRIGILHRDIKPSNCFVDADGKVKIGDFGLSINTMIRCDASLTLHGAFMGTPAHAPPEQLRGDEWSVRSDLYALGVTCYYLLTAKLPFEAPNLPQLIAAVLDQTPAPPARLRPNIPQGLSAIVMRCIEKNPDKRFQAYTELHRALLPYAAPAPAPAPLTDPVPGRTTTRIGPYAILENLPPAADTRAWRLGFDKRLLRHVWIRVMHPDDPPVDPAQRNLGRPGRLRWLHGKRTPAQAWDTYEAPAGQPLTELLRCRWTWGRVRPWLLDLGRNSGRPSGCHPARRLGIEPGLDYRPKPGQAA